MKLPRRSVEVFSLSFLDCICCGFGAIILLLVLTEYGKPVATEEKRQRVHDQQVELQKELEAIQGDTEELSRRLEGRINELQQRKHKLAHLAGDLTNVRGQFSASKKEASVTNIVESELVSAHQTLTKEMERLLKERSLRPKTEAVGGIPIDSEYIIFVQDTSSSMNSHWQLAVQVMQEILSLYPRVKGLQVMNDQGRYMFEGTKGQWLADSQERRDQIVKRMRNWRPFSQSNPVPGILEAVRTYWAPEKRFSIYVLGDEFTGDSIQDALTEIARLNKPDTNGRRVARIHAIGYMNAPDYPPFTNIRFGALMRLVCSENNGAFVALTE
jgi:molecular chaperone GrpE (heat shock protein)